jgi:hypothetical protein
MKNNDVNVVEWVSDCCLTPNLEVKGQGPTKVIMVHDTSPYGHAPIYQISLTYLERQKYYGPDKKILVKNQLVDNDLCGTLTFDLKAK